MENTNTTAAKTEVKKTKEQILAQCREAMEKVHANEYDINHCSECSMCKDGCHIFCGIVLKWAAQMRNEEAAKNEREIFRTNMKNARFRRIDEEGRGGDEYEEDVDIDEEESNDNSDDDNDSSSNQYVDSDGTINSLGSWQSFGLCGGRGHFGRIDSGYDSFTAEGRDDNW